MMDDTTAAFSFPAVERKKVTAAFDGGRITSDGGVMLLAMAERRLGIADRLARCFPDRRDPSRVTHSFADMIRARIFAIGCGYEDADDLDFLRSDPAFKLACGRLAASARFAFLFIIQAADAIAFAILAASDAETAALIVAVTGDAA